jgi:preprotein translocase SecE subunit
MSEMSSDRQQRRAARRAGREPAATPRPVTSGAPVETERKRRSNFINDSWSELKKVEWPGQSQVIAGTVVVLVACFVVGTFLYINDQIWKQVVSKVFLGQ